VKYKCIFIIKIVFNVVKSYLNENLRLFIDQKHCDFNIFICQCEKNNTPVFCDVSKLYNQGQLHIMSLVIKDYFN